MDVGEEQTTSVTSINMLVCDDHKVIFQGVQAMLFDYPNLEALEYADSLPSLINRLKTKRFSLLILDLNISGINSLEHISEIRAQQPNIKIVIFSSYDNPTLVKKAQAENVNAFLVKNSDSETFIDAITKTLKGERFYEKSDKVIHTANSEIDHIKQEVELSTREQEIAILMVSGHNEQELAEKLFISKHTVRTHKKNIFRKLKVSGTPGLIKYLQAKRGVF